MGNEHTTCPADPIPVETPVEKVGGLCGGPGIIRGLAVSAEGGE